MKKLVVLFLVLIMIFSLTACGGGGGSETSSESPAPAESGEKQSVDEELSRLKELYDGEWINEDPYDGPFEMEVLSATGVRMTYKASGELICDLFYSPGELTNISISLSGNSLGKYSIDTQTGILTFRPNDTDVFTYTKE